MDDASCDACSYSEVYDAGFVESWNVGAAAIKCEGTRMCGQGQGNKAYKAFAVSEPVHVNSNPDATTSAPSDPGSGGDSGGEGEERKTS